MNKTQRKKLSDLAADLEEAQAQIEYINAELKNVRDNELKRLDNMPKNIQYGKRGELMREYIRKMDSVKCDLSSIFIMCDEGICRLMNIAKVDSI